MPRTLTLACIQFTPSDDVQDNIDRVAERVREAAKEAAADAARVAATVERMPPPSSRISV